jgi:hypothetical protein
VIEVSPSIVSVCLAPTVIVRSLATACVSSWPTVVFMSYWAWMSIFSLPAVSSISIAL